MAEADTASLVDREFIAIRAQLLEVAAFLDRAERAKLSSDFRVKALKETITLLDGLNQSVQEAGDAQRVKQILESFSDSSEEPLKKATEKGASGVYQAS